MRLLIPIAEHPNKPENPILMSRQDLCCAPHAFVAALVLAVFGQRTRVARGGVIIVNERLLFPIINHHFVIREGDSRIFDSSITMPDPPQQSEIKLEGIGFNDNSDRPHLSIMLSNAVPPQSKMELLRKSVKNDTILYYAEEESRPPEFLMEMKVPGFTGKQFEQRFGSQIGLWPRFAWVVAEELKVIPPAEMCFDQEILENKVKKTPMEIIHKLRTICRKLH